MAAVRTVVSIRRGGMPRPGPVVRPWAWEDVLEAPPPVHRAVRAESAYVVRHGLDEAPDVEARLGFSTLVRVSNGSVVVDEQLLVEPRVLSPVLRAERAVTTRLEKGTRASAHLVTRGSEAIGSVVPGRAGRAVRTGGGWVARGLSWATDTLVEGLRSIVEAPDRLASGRASASAHLSAKRERRAFLKGLLDPYRLTSEGKAAALFLATVGILVLALVVSLGVFFFAPERAVEWRSLLLFFLLGVGSTVLFPFFPELRLQDVAQDAGPVPAIAAVSLGMTLGGWIVLFLGDAIHGALRKGIRPGSGLARVLDKAEDFARRRGFWAAFLILAIPMGPDTPVFYLLASVRTPPHKYLLGTLLGTLTRFSLFYYVPIVYADLVVRGFGV